MVVRMKKKICPTRQTQPVGDELEYKHARSQVCGSRRRLRVQLGGVEDPWCPASSQPWRFLFESAAEMRAKLDATDPYLSATGALGVRRGK
jgi:hypothetical protein